MKIISILNHKGGVGKTTTTINLGAGLAQLGYRVLLIDLDGQENLSYAFRHNGSDTHNVYQAMKGNLDTLPIVTISERLHLVPSHLDLGVVDLELASEPGREAILSLLLTPHKEQYNYILIDCPPSLGLLTINALTASQEIIIPVEAEPFAYKGMRKLQEVIQKVQKRINPDLHILGVLITKYDGRKNLHQVIKGGLTQNINVFDTLIRTNISLSEAHLQQCDIFTHAPKSNGAIDYLEFSKEVETKTQEK